MATATTKLPASLRDVDGSREARRLRRAGQIPGVVYGGGEDPVALQIEVLTLRRVLAHAGQIVDLDLDGTTIPVLLKDTQRHPVNGEPVHVDLLRVRMDVAIQTTVVVELVGFDDAPGAKEGGVIEQVNRDVTVEALPGDIPDGLQLDVSGMEVNDTLTLADLIAPSGVTLVDEPETVLVTCTPPRLEVEPTDEIEEETGLVGEGEAAPAGEAAAESGG
ncbi:MAG: ribosomal rRNA E-loop binding protein Ctc/L25/TL5, partial [Solirubrobacterales bacterium]|nr:ribosomal rRNA E-loop binding protein Ctc/L25/TL5 [Solirubrobacterales bacterium]